ncbi:hypothetical protein OG373_31330 [Streptomyces avidinii]|uniref:hypothetical protein n=1 Tax=Streptomyces avidinii TaxID=1895 RepID=UPI00386FF6FB|nr:hypothetical protein OG373_31330 [Streptomyces avidinii]
MSVAEPHLRTAGQPACIEKIIAVPNIPLPYGRAIHGGVAGDYTISRTADWSRHELFAAIAHRRSRNQASGSAPSPSGSSALTLMVFPCGATIFRIHGSVPQEISTGVSNFHGRIRATSSSEGCEVTFSAPHTVNRQAMSPLVTS